MLVNIAKIVMIIRCFIVSMLICSAYETSALALDALAGTWTLQVQNTQRQTVATLVVRFIEDKAEPCLGGTWKKVAVDSYKTSAPYFFPAQEPLSYKLEGNNLWIGRNEVCDAYLQLIGVLKESSVAGEYISFGWEREKLGYFLLTRKSKQKAN